MTKTHTDTQGGWEKEFDDRFKMDFGKLGVGLTPIMQDVKAFIQQTLTQQAEEIFEEILNESYESISDTKGYDHHGVIGKKIAELKERYTL